jgi:hypothetical protein
MKTPQVQTLRAAHELLNRDWPGRGAPASARLAHHQRAAELYDHVAEIDPDHRYEARYWAQREREAAQAIADQLAVSVDGTRQEASTGMDVAVQAVRPGASHHSPCERNGSA